MRRVGLGRAGKPERREQTQSADLLTHESLRNENDDVWQVTGRLPPRTGKLRLVEKREARITQMGDVFLQYCLAGRTAAAASRRPTDQIGGGAWVARPAVSGVTNSWGVPDWPAGGGYSSAGGEPLCLARGVSSINLTSWV